MPAMQRRPMHFQCHQICSSADGSTVIAGKAFSCLHFPPPNYRLYLGFAYLIIFPRSQCFLHYPPTVPPSENVGRATVTLLMHKY